MSVSVDIYATVAVSFTNRRQWSVFSLSAVVENNNNDIKLYLLLLEER